MASYPTRLAVNLNTARRCTSQKLGFATKDEALDTAERMMERGAVNPGCHITPYECRDCRQWHVYNRRIVWSSDNRR